MEGEQVRRLIEQHRAEIPADLAAEMTRYYVNQNANSDNFSIIANSDISTTRDFSSTNGSEADQREVVDALESDIERLDWPLDWLTIILRLMFRVQIMIFCFIK